MDDLPDYILSNILLRVPMVTLATVAWHVCRSWREIIQQRNFSLSHRSSYPGILLQLPSSSCRYFCKRLSGTRGFRDDNVHYCAFITGRRPSFHVLWKDFFAMWYLQVRHSCDGLLLLSSKHCPALICNPLLRRWARLPEDPLLKPVYGPWKRTGCMGLGFDPKEEVYKVIHFIKPSDEKGYQKARVCTLGAGDWEWKTAEQGDLEYEVSGRYRHCASVDGKLHWLAYHREQTTLISVDIQSESVSLVQLPMLRDRSPLEVRVGVAVAGGPLVVWVHGQDWEIRSEFGVEEAEFWVMRDYNQQESWTKELTISLKEYNNFRFSCSSYVDCDFADNTWWLLLNWKKILNLRDSMFGKVRAITVPYIPSLVWLQSGFGCQKPLRYSMVTDIAERLQGFQLQKGKEIYEFNRMWPALECSCGSLLALLNHSGEYYICENPKCNNFMWRDRSQEQIEITGDNRANMLSEIAALKYETIMLRNKIKYLMKSHKKLNYLLRIVTDYVDDTYEDKNQLVYNYPKEKSDADRPHSWEWKKRKHLNDVIEYSNL